MIVAFSLYPEDNDNEMLGDDTYRSPHSAGFHDWRFGKDGVPHPATCPTCGRKTDPDYVNPDFRATKRKWDVSGTVDGYTIVSKRFRDYCKAQRWKGMRFVPLPADDDFFVLRLTSVLRVDAKRSETMFEDRCPKCRAFYSVIGGAEYLRGVKKPIKEGFFRSDLEFASGPEQAPLILVGIDTAAKLRKKKFQRFHLEAVMA